MNITLLKHTILLTNRFQKIQHSCINLFEKIRLFKLCLVDVLGDSLFDIVFRMLG